jgi:hypothetical protein
MPLYSDTPPPHCKHHLLVQVREQVLRPEERGGGERVRPDDLRALGHGDVRLPRRRKGPQPLLRRQADPAHLPGKGRISREEFTEDVTLSTRYHCKFTFFY